MSLGRLSAIYGNQEALRLSTAYEAVLMKLSAGECDRMPDRSIRVVIVQAMIEEGRTSGFATNRLTDAGLLAARAPSVRRSLFKRYPWTIGAGASAA